ncbi:MAG: hypothetical protein M3P17_03615, partial [Thermoproteota archaeon]|nr:hypothetical protein [Thermoproteota archaeon]
CIHSMNLVLKGMVGSRYRTNTRNAILQNTFTIVIIHNISYLHTVSSIYATFVANMYYAR